jgi:dCTP deaminase
MIDPFSRAVQDGGVISYGLTHAGYDLRLGYTVLVFKNSYAEVVDPKRFKDPDYQRRVFEEIDELREGQSVLVPPHGYVLGYTLEYLRIPRFVKGRAVGKSTLARSGILINTTPAEPTWQGHLTLEIANITPCPVAIYAGEGICQMEFEEISRGGPTISYADKKGKYQGQGPEPVPARVKP